MAQDSPHVSFRDIPNNTNKKWWKDASLRLNVLYCFGCMMCPFYLGYDQSLLTGLQALPQWNEYFDSPHGTRLGLIAACIFLPGIIFGFPAAWICTHWGRKWCVIIGAAFIVVGAIWNGLAPDLEHFMVSRVILGIGGSITKVGAPALLQESAHPRIRSEMGHMYYGFYYVGSLVSAIMCIIGLYIPSSWGWRVPCLGQIIGPIVVLLILIKAPESPRYMIKKGMHDKALHTLAKYHANGDTNDALVKWEMREIEQTIEQESQDNKSSYLDFFKTRGNRKRLWISLSISVGINWVGNGIVSYYLSPVLKSVGVVKPSHLLSINAGLSVWNLIIAEAAALKIDDYGIRPLFLTSTIGMIISYAFVMGFSAGFAETGTSALGIAAIPFLFTFFGSYSLAWTPLNYSYTTTIMPFNLRAKGLALYLVVQNMANAFNQFVNPIALQAITWKYYAVYIAIDITYAIGIYLWFPETKQLTIEEISLVFDFPGRDGRKMAAAALANRMRDGGSTDRESDSVKADMNHVESK
ncbi:hypothetical protein BHE90_007881 [Fusarium euwallaceae]|uniref:Major facilitator superfamily (MFS) profile domain-containing protein n=1 Tax=Fusarium euwallaceae TaxID=1147111 RepID=A0A430LPL1_9HYPO|nr:hypothetical protein BHE90_007881 [Fusarium euwallaceae]